MKAFKTGLWLILLTRHDLRVMWDGGTKVAITVRPSLKFHVNGLCGSYNGRSSDDMTTPSGDIEQDPYIFASEWKTEPSCQDFGDQGEPPSGACDVRIA